MNCCKTETITWNPPTPRPRDKAICLLKLPNGSVRQGYWYGYEKCWVLWEDDGMYPDEGNDVTAWAEMPKG